MNAKEYRAYREEQEYIQKQNHQSVQKNASTSDICIVPSIIRPKIKENASKGLIRATLKGYSNLNIEIEKLRTIIHNYKAHAGVAIYGNTAIHTSTKKDLSDTLAKVEDNKRKFARLVFMERWLENALYGLHGLRAEYIIYIIEVYLRGRGEPSRGKTHRIIGVILEKGIDIPTVEQAKLAVNENGRG